MEFFNSAVDTLQTIVVGLGGALCVWGGINLLEGYGQDNPGSKSQGVKQLVAGGGVAHTLAVTLQGIQLILVYFLTIKQQSAYQGRFAIIHRAGGQESQQVLLLVLI